MLGSANELVEKIGLGEDTFLEYKQVLFAGKRMTAPSRKDVADGLAAFANSRGGVFVLGVEDKQREIVGIALERLDDAERLVREVCRDAIDPPLAPTIERLYLPRRKQQQSGPSLRSRCRAASSCISRPAATCTALAARSAACLRTTSPACSNNAAKRD